MSKLPDFEKEFKANLKKSEPKRMTEKQMRAMFEQTEQELPAEKKEKPDLEDPANMRMTEKEMRAEKQALHELPANYVPLYQQRETAPMVIDKRIVVGVALLCALLVLGAIGYKLYQKNAVAGAGEIDMQLIMGRNVKRNMDGGTWATLSLPADLAVSDLLKTGSDRRNVIALPDGTTIRLDYASTVKINSVKALKEPDSYDVHVTLHKGALFVDEQGDSRITVETKYACFEPVGTRFCITQLERKDLTEQSVVNVVEGSVSMHHLDDPNSRIIVTAGQQASATSQSLVKPRKAEKNDWVIWNSKWRDIRSVPSLKGAKLRTDDQPTEDKSSSNSSAATSSPKSDDNGMPVHHNSGGNEQGSSSQPSSQPQSAPSDYSQSNPANYGEHVENHIEREAREARERAAREAQEREEAARQQEYDQRRAVQEQRRNEQSENDRINEEFRKSQENEQKIKDRNKKIIDKYNPKNPKQAEAERLHPDQNLLAPTGKIDLPTGNITDLQYEHRQQLLKQRDADQPGGGIPSGGEEQPHQGHRGNRGMMPVGDSSQLDARIGDSNSMDAVHGDSSSMDAKTGEMW